MTHARLRSVLLVWSASIAISCTWSRFDDVTSNPPVERLETPGSATGIGLSMAAYATRSGAMLAATSTDQLVVYDLGSGVQPSLNAATIQSCAGDASCVLGKQLAGIGPQNLFDNLGCVAYGVGTATDGSGAETGQVWLFCEDLQRRALPVPEAVAGFVTGSMNRNTAVTFSTTRSGSPQPLVVAIQDASAIWYYDGADSTPIALPALPDGQPAGRALAVIAESSSSLVVASTATPDNEVWLYRVSSDRTAALVGCIQGPAQFGRLLATGRFDDDTIDDLAVADGDTVHIVSGSSLATLADAADPTCVPLESVQSLGQVLCPQLSELDGCAAQPFATSMVAGNLDAAGHDELIVGAANTSVRGESAAGAAFIHTVTNGSLKAVQGLYVSTASSGDELGSSVAIAHVSDIDTVIAGAPGSSSVMVFYCNSLIPAQSKSARCP